MSDVLSDPEWRIGAVVTAYRPDSQFAERFAPIAGICEGIIVVDNTPGGHAFGALGAPFEIVQDGRNKGLGPALNSGIRRAQQLGCDTVVLFDQDSTPSLALLAGLKKACLRAGPERCVIGPRHVDDHGGGIDAHSPERANTSSGLTPMTCLPTSGMLFRLKDWPHCPLFSDQFFLDFVDFDWCWRMGKQGWRFFVASNVPMLHRLGVEQRRVFGLTYHVPAPYRHYFQFRDTLRLAVQRHVPLYPRLRLLGVLPLKLLVYPWLLDRGRERLSWMLRGIIDAVRGRTGAGAASHKLGVS